MAIFYVRKTGNNSNNGTSPSTAKLTINGALTACANGDTIYVGAGSYNDNIGSGVSAKSNITLIADCKGLNAVDKGKVILNGDVLQFSNTDSWTNLTIKNFISITSTYSCYTNNVTTKFINCIFYAQYGISSLSSFYNCNISGSAYAWTNNMGSNPTAVVNCIVNGPLDGATLTANIPNANNYKLATFTEIFVSRGTNDWNVSSTYLSNVKNLGTTGANIPTTDYFGVNRDNTPWIGACDVGTEEILLYINGTKRTNIDDMLVGDIISCEYVASSGAVGVFSNLGNTSKASIPAASTATPDGSFYFVCVGEDWLGRKKLVADRNIQHTISWDAINTSGICSSIQLVTMNQFFNPLAKAGSITLSNWGRTANLATANWNFVKGILGKSSGKWYWEVTADSVVATNEFAIGIATSASSLTDPYTTGYYTYCADGRKMYSGFQKVLGWGAAFSQGDVIGVLLDLDNGTLAFTKNGVSQGTAYTGLSGTFYPFLMMYGTRQGTVNFTDAGLNSSVPSGYSVFCSVSNQYALTVKLLTGGVSPADKDNEWDKIIVESTLNSTITAGDNNVWNWNGVYSDIATTPMPGLTLNGTSDGRSRVKRGGPNGANYWIYSRPDSFGTSGVADYIGFRPVLIVEQLASPPVFNNMSHPLTTHTSAQITGSITNDATIQYRISVNGSYVYPDAIGSYTNLATNPSLNYTVLATSLILGSNNILIEAVTSTNQQATWSTTIDKTNIVPTGSFALASSTTHTSNVLLTGTITETETDEVSYRISVGGVVKVDWTIGKNISYNIQHTDLLLGDTIILIEYRDKINSEYGEVQSWSDTLTKINAAPTANLSVPTIAHSNNILLTGTLSDTDGDQIWYRITLNGTVKVDWTNGSNISYLITIANLVSGDNALLVEYKDAIDSEYGTVQEWTETIAFTNQNPILSVTPPQVTALYNSNAVISGTINDPDADQIKYRVLLNGVVQNEWSVNVSTPYPFSVTIVHTEMQTGSNTVNIEYTDNIGTTQSWNAIIYKKELDSIYYTATQHYEFTSSLIVDQETKTLIKLPDLVRTSGYVKSYLLELDLINGSALTGDIEVALIRTNWSSGTFSNNTPPTIDSLIKKSYNISDTGHVTVDITSIMEQAFEKDTSFGVSISATDFTIEINALTIDNVFEYQPSIVEQPTVSHGNKVDKISWKSLILGGAVFTRVEVKRSKTLDFADSVLVYTTTNPLTLFCTDTTDIVVGESYYYRLDVVTGSGTKTTNSILIPIPIPESGFKNLFEDGQYNNYLSDGIAFDGVDAGYDFYTTPDRIALRPLDLNNGNQIIGGRTSSAVPVELVNGYNNKSFSLTVYASTFDGEVAEDVGYSGRINDYETNEGKTLVELSLTGDPSFNPQYPLIFNLAPQEKKIIYIRVKPSIFTEVGSKSFKVKVKGGEI